MNATAEGVIGPSRARVVSYIVGEGIVITRALMKFGGDGAVSTNVRITDRNVIKLREHDRCTPGGRCPRGDVSFPAVYVGF